jgi:hypothetical protein
MNDKIQDESPEANTKMGKLAHSPQVIPNVKTRFKVVAAIPCYNTQAHIAEVIAKAKRYVDDVIVIDDGSTDKTVEAARKAGANVISHGKNLGKGAALKTALKNIEGDILIFIDGDGQHDPGDIPRLLEPILFGKADFVIGSRYLAESKLEHNPFIRKVSNLVASLIISFVISLVVPVIFSDRRNPAQKTSEADPKKSNLDLTLGCSNIKLLTGRIKWVTDCTSGFTAMRVTSCQYLDLVSNGFEIETEMIFEQAKNHFVIAEIPISCRWGLSKSKLSIAEDGLSTLWLLIKKVLIASKPHITRVRDGRSREKFVKGVKYLNSNK